MPCVAVEQARRGMQLEREQQAVWFGQVQRAFEGAVGGAGVAERVPGDRLKNVRLGQTVLPGHRRRSIHDRGERVGRGTRIPGSQPQRGGGDADLAVFAVSVRRFVETVRRYRTIQIQAGQRTLTAADPARPR